MKAFSENNPVIIRMKELQALWYREVKKNTQLVHWLIDESEEQMINAFYLTEADTQGVLDGYFILFDVPFENAETYGKVLLDHWLATWNNEEYRNEVKNVLPEWDCSPFANVSNKDAHLTFLECMSSFAKSIADDAHIFLTLIPKNNRSLGGDWEDWIIDRIKELPPNLKITLINYKRKNLFKYLSDKINHVKLEPNINMAGMMQETLEAAKGTNEKGIDVNYAMLKLLEASGNKDMKGAKHWADKGIEIAQKMQVLSMEATIYMAYGSAFYQIKKYNDAVEQFATAEQLCLKALNNNPDDISSQAILVQAYNFLAATHYVKRERDRAAEYYIKTAETAKYYNNIPLYIESYRFVALIKRKKWEKSKAWKTLLAVYNTVKDMDKQMLMFSSMLPVCIELHRLAKDIGEFEKMKEFDKFATDIWGENWQELEPENILESINHET